jgi:uncharacterized OsmC-like protein
MTTTFNLRERQAPLKEQFKTDPSTAQVTMSVRSITETIGDPTRVRIQSDEPNGAIWDVSAHSLAGGEGDIPCSGDLFLASLAACQEVTIRMVAAAMRIELIRLDLAVEGDMDFRGTMGVDADTPVGYQAVRINVEIEADAPADRLERLVQRAEQYCVVSSTLHHPPSMTMNVAVNNDAG